MKLNESSNYTVKMYTSGARYPDLSFKSNHVRIDSPRVNINNNNYTFAFGSALIMQIDLNTVFSEGKTIIIEDEELHKVNDDCFLFAKNNPNYTFYSSVYNYIEEHNKDIAVFVYSSGKPIAVYIGNRISYYIPAELAKTTEITIDDKKLYLHHATFEIIPKPLLKKYIKGD